MEDLLKPVKTTRTVKTNIEKFENLSIQDRQSKEDSPRQLSAIPEGSPAASDVVRILKESLLEENGHPGPSKDGLKPSDSVTEASFDARNEAVSSSEQALHILKTQHDGDAVEAVARFLYDGIQKKHDFNVQVPSPEAAQIVNLLVNDVIPDLWPVLKNDRPEDRMLQRHLLLCMSSPAGIGALLARLQHLVDTSSVNKPGFDGHDAFRDAISFFNALAKPGKLLGTLLTQTQTMDKVTATGVWREITSLFAGSKILNVLQYAAAIPKLYVFLEHWMLNPEDFVGWIGSNIVHAAMNIFPPSKDVFAQLAEVLHRAMSLGHSGRWFTMSLHV